MPDHYGAVAAGLRQLLWQVVLEILGVVMCGVFIWVQITRQDERNARPRESHAPTASTHPNHDYLVMVSIDRK